MEDMLHFEGSNPFPPHLQPSDGSLCQLFEPLGSIPIDDESDTLGHDSINFKSPELFASGVLNPDAFMSLDGPRHYQSVSDSVAHERYEEPLNLPSAGEVCYESPKSSRYSEDSQSIIPEHYGPGCWLSVCSPSGLAWVQQRAGADDFASIAADLTAAWAKQLKLERDEPTLRSPEPGAELAWRYSHAYFERSVDSLFEVVYRPEFEWHLRGHLENTYRNDDPAWYALRNAVYASGCRLYHSANHAACFTRIQDEAWRYFSNALSVHSELLLRSPSQRAVRALLAMALFAEGLGSPALGSGLIANAMLLSQSLGLHRKVIVLESALDTETLKRLWLFWAVYCCEKSIARRTGRPSVIDDDDIGCGIPTVVHSRSTIDPAAVRCIIRSCQISSRICKRLMSVRSLEGQLMKVLDIVTDCDKQLRSWKDSLPVAIRPQDRLKQFQVSRDTSSLAQILLHCSYYDLVMVLHAPFAYPWMTKHLCSDTNTNLRTRVNAQIAQSSEATVEAARNIIVMARNFEINGANTHAFMLHYPMHAFINLFIYVIQFPHMKSVRTDLALLDMAAGYFGQMDFVTGSKLSFPFARDIATFGRQTVDSYSEQSASSPSCRESLHRQGPSVASATMPVSLHPYSSSS
ncbi:uncharacterized protein Z518_04950 [Rhinocladiella mackenziei CBS 650.93]|uniref:Xylanolytic transcriptional activator regulatory domain-containing protein n=1 Tax=Rhinocladiella mackenziei CBS 650.93 TaxID=1442369 RepID=A0A0D2IMJ8_9EURO|nr:uncharacterized protein Z518_04950 [Rhinocladiella mackenziei CBS 650.93]KIX06974.1 hypothetical protein Z518_04950 [Rhinocladiella mackenziei CBS 650.93]